jgi:hypothetical protein
MPIYPISFSIPSQHVLDEVPIKTKHLATVIPGNPSTYVFSTQQSYYGDYQASVFGKTWKKGGWDCMRHYEILANGCIPWFEGLDKCPPKTLTHLPKDLIKQAMASDTPETFIPALLEHTRAHLTTRAMARYVLEAAGHPNAKRVLFLSSDDRPDYLRCSLLSGFKELLGKECSESVVVPHIYDDYGPTDHLYGRGFSYTRSIPASSKPAPVHIDDIKNHKFDLVIYGSLHRGMPAWETVKSAYLPSEIVLVCGEEGDDHVCDGYTYASQGHPVFIREQLS